MPEKLSCLYGNKTRPTSGMIIKGSKGISYRSRGEVPVYCPNSSAGNRSLLPQALSVALITSVVVV